MQNGKNKKQKEIKENNGRQFVIQDSNCEEKQVKRKEIDVLDADKKQEKQNDDKTNDDVKQQEEKDIEHINHDVEKQNGDKIKALNCDTEPKKLNGIEANCTVKKDIIVEKKIEIEINDLSDDSNGVEQEKALDSTIESKMQNYIEGNNNDENQKENDTIKGTIRNLRQRKRSGREIVADGNKQHKPNKIEDKDQNAVSSRRPIPRHAKLNAPSKIYIQSEPFEVIETRRSPRNAM